MNNNTVILSIAAILLVFIILSFYLKRQPNKKEEIENWPFYAAKPLSQPEQVLYHRLANALPDCIILAQVQLSRILRVKKGFNKNEWNNRINRKSLDFVICKKDSSIIAVIELDDKSHEQEDRKYADANKDKALKSANIKIIRWQVKTMPSVDEIRNLIIQN